MPDYDVFLLVRLPVGVTVEQVGFELAVDGPKFIVEVEEREDDGRMGVRCRGVKASGVAAMPEALRVAQVGLSTALKRTIPAYAEHGGLLWSDVLRAEAIATS